MNYLAILRDSLRETLDRKSLYFLLVVSILVIMVCASFGFRELDAEGSLKYVVGDFGKIWNIHRIAEERRPKDLNFTISDIREEDRGSNLDLEYSFTLTAKPAKEFHRAIHIRAALDGGRVKEQDDPIEGITGDVVTDPGPDRELRYLRARFREAMLGRVEVEAQKAAENERAYRVHVKVGNRSQLEGAYEVSILFGVWRDRLPVSLALVVAFAEIAVADHIAGFWGVIIAIIFTAGFIPGMLQKGTLDLLLAKPVRRPFVLLTKYVGGLFYVLIPAVVLLGGSWLVISARTGVWNFGFLSSIGILIVIFAVLYAFTVLMGVMTRSTIAAILLTVGLWFFSWAVTVGHMVLNSPKVEGRVPAAITKTVGALRYGLPRVTEWGQASQYVTMQANLGKEMDALREDRAEKGLESPKWLSLVLSSAAFIAAMLALACWFFARRDY